jgi:uncharacterized protein
VQFNVSQLLASSPGDERRYTFEEDERRYPELAGGVRGSVRLMRTDRAVLVMASIGAGARCTCSRCLTDFVQPVQFEVEEEFFPVMDVESGARLKTPDNGVFTIDSTHILDLGEATRQYAILNAPMKPLCREVCAGLCPSCGANRNLGDCGCVADTADPRWSKLASLKTELAESTGERQPTAKPR